MKKNLLIGALFSVIAALSFGQQNPVNCDLAVPGCTTPSFGISTNNTGNIPDFTTGCASNPTTNPNSAPGNSGCLLSGETTSTFITITAVSNGTLEWSIQGPSGGCFDWIMWPYTLPTGGGVSPTCAMLQNCTQAPVACNWNGSCQGFTGMANPGNLPPGASQLDFEYGLNVTAGQSFLLCLSNYSGTTQNVNLDFFGSANISCIPSTPDQTICENTSAIVDVSPPPGFVNPTYNWLVTTGVSNPNSGTNVTVTPATTTEYIVAITNNDPNTPTTTVNDTFNIIVVPEPAPNAGIDDTVCFGQPIYLSGTLSDPANNSGSWTYNTSGISPTPSVSFSNPNSMTPTVNVNQLGLYSFILRENNPVCGIRRDTVRVLVANITQTVTFVAPTCNGGSDGEIHVDSPTADEYSFDGGNTWVVDSFAIGLPAGTYNVCSRNALGCDGCESVTITEPAAMTITASNDTLICENGTATLIASATGGTTYDYHWGHTSDLSASQAVMPASATTYSVYAENEFGCTSPTEQVTVSVRPPLSGTISGNDTICPGYPTNIYADATDGFGAPYTFAFSDGTNNSGPNATISVNPPSTTTYTVTITDACESTPLVLSTEIYVAPVPEPQFSVVEQTLCEPAVFTVSDDTDPAMDASNYWVISDGQMYLNQDTIYTEEMYFGTYDVQLVVTSPLGCIDSLTQQAFLNVNPLPVADFRFSPSPATVFNTEVKFDNYSVNGDTYQWFFPGADPATSSYTNPTVMYPEGQDGQYDVTLVTTSEFGCMDTMIKTVVVVPEILFYAPNSFTPDNDEFNQSWGIHIEGIDVYDFELLIFNRWGEVIWESHDPSVNWDGTYQGKPVPHGAYSWIIRTKDAKNDKKYTFNGTITLIR